MFASRRRACRTLTGVPAVAVTRAWGRLLFDVATNAHAGAPDEELALVARRIREVGVGRVVYGSDAALPGSTPREGWAAFRRLPLAERELRKIASSVAPYMRRRGR